MKIKKKKDIVSEIFKKSHKKKYLYCYTIIKKSHQVGSFYTICMYLFYNF